MNAPNVLKDENIIAVQSGHKIPMVNCAGQSFCHDFEQPITDGMAMAFVDLFETVKIDQHHDQVVDFGS